MVQRSRDAAVQCILCQWDMRYRRSVLPPSQPRAPCGVWALPFGRRRSTAPHACLYVWCVPHGWPAGMARMAGSRTGRRSSTPASTSRARSALSGTPYAGYYAIYRRIGCVRCRYCSRCRVPASVSATAAVHITHAATRTMGHSLAVLVSFEQSGVVCLFLGTARFTAETK